MTALEILEEVFTAKYPNGTFAFTSEVRGDKNERYNDKEVSTPLCLIVPDVTDDFSAENGQFTDRLNFRMLLLESNTDHWKTFTEKETNIVAPLRIAGQELLTRAIYRYPESITVDNPFNAQGTSIYDWGSGNHSGIGYRFSVNQMNELNICSDPITYSFDLSSTLGGIATSSLGGEGSYPEVDKGTLIAISATPDEGSSFDYFDINGIEETTNPVCIEAVQNYTIEANFIAAVLTIFMDLFTTAPVNGRWLNQDGDVNNYADAKNNQVGNFTGYTHLDTGYKITGQTQLNIDHNFYLGNTSKNQMVWGGGSFTPSLKGISMKFFNNKTLYMQIANGSTIQLLLVASGIDEGFYESTFDWSGMAGEQATINLNGTDYFVTPTIDWVGESSRNVLIGVDNNGSSDWFEGFVCYTRIHGKLTYHYCEALGIDIINYEGTINGALVNANESSFWEIGSDSADPIVYELGTTIFSNDSGVTRVFTPLGTTSYNGWAKIGDFPAGSGLLKGVKTEVEFNNSTDLETFAVKYPFFDTLIKYRYDQIRAWDTNAEIEKTEDTNSISQLIFKS